MGNMNDHDLWTDRLSDYADDELPAAERAAVDEHLRACNQCRDVLADLRAVADRARALTDLPPSQDLWPGIAGEIGHGSTRGSRGLHMLASRTTRRFSFTVPQLVAASLALMVSSGGMVWLARLGGARTDFPAVVAVPEPPEPTAVPATLADAHYDEAIADLQQALDAGRSKLDAETVRVLELNLIAIDRAIDQCRRALAADPANTYLNDHLVAAKKRKLGLLRRATAMADGA
jgi:tetratricopeptide (TPR) repeat protein